MDIFLDARQGVVKQVTSRAGQCPGDKGPNPQKAV